MIIIKYKLVCIDMDGTLLNSKRKISDFSREIIKKAHDTGVHIVISTGRLYADAEAYSDLIGVRSPIIASNGAVIRGIEKNDIIYKNIISEDVCLKLLNIFKEYDMGPCFNTPESVYCRSLLVKLFYDFVKFKGAMSNNFKLQYVQSWGRLKNIINSERSNIVKCEIINNSADKIRKIREALQKLTEVEIVGTSDYNIEITNKGVSKGKAIEVISSCFNIKKEEIIAIGDSENDLSMIEFAGVGVAMGNAIESVKRRASYITDTNDNNGAAKAINKFVLGNEI